jgi:hypothetical protein
MMVHRVLELEMLYRALVGWAVVAAVTHDEDVCAANAYRGGRSGLVLRGDGEFGADA